MSRLARRTAATLSPSQTIVLSFCAFIMFGALLLSMPALHAGPPH